MENCAIDLMMLPDEVLLEILSFVPDRFEVSQVCKKFYELICVIDRNRYKLCIGNYGEKVSHEIIFSATQAQL